MPGTEANRMYSTVHICVPVVPATSRWGYGIRNIDKNIIQLESDKLLNKRSEKEVTGIIENLRSHRLNVLSKKEKLKEQIKGNKNDLRWIDWVEDFSIGLKEKVCFPYIWELNVVL